ncbi:MAG: DUF2059 domain-containing protein [Deltaproteobacteria bacterium]|jgi:hypothetical protein
MNRMTKSCWGALLLMLFTLGLPACQQRTADTPENRLEAARAYQRVSPLKVTLDDAIKELATQLAPDQRSDFIQFMRMKISSEAVEQKAVQAMANHFTVREIRALTKFYSSPEGRAINEKYGDYMNDLMPVIQSQLAQAAKAWLAQQQQKDQEQQAQPEPPASPQEPEGKSSPATPEKGGNQNKKM